MKCASSQSRIDEAIGEFQTSIRLDDSLFDARVQPETAGEKQEHQKAFFHNGDRDATTLIEGRCGSRW
jgi:hypothetical protein